MECHKYIIFYIYCLILLIPASIYGIYSEIPAIHHISSNACARVPLIGLFILVTNLLFTLLILFEILLPKINITKIGVTIVVLFNIVNIWSIIATYPLSQNCINFYQTNFNHLWRMMIIQDFIYLLIMSVMCSIMIYNKYHGKRINKIAYMEMESI